MTKREYFSKRREGVGEDDVLEALKRTHRRLVRARDGRSRTAKWEFSAWGSCTCGHIYAGVAGRKGAESSVTNPVSNPVYEEALKAVVRGNKLVDRVAGGRWNPRHPGAMLHAVVSDATLMIPRVNRMGRDQQLDRAIELVENAIALVEKEYEKARKALVADVTQKLPQEQRPMPERNEVPSPAHRGPARTEGDRTEATA